MIYGKVERDVICKSVDRLSPFLIRVNNKKPVTMILISKE